MAEDVETEIKQLYRAQSMGGGPDHFALEDAVKLYRERTGASANDARARVEAIIAEVRKNPGKAEGLSS